MVPNTGPYDAEVNTNAVSALLDKIGQRVLITHSQSGALGWRTAIKNRNIKAIASYEPGKVGVTQVGERIWLVTFMHCDLGYFDDETCRLEPIDNPFGSKALPMSSE